MEPLRRLGLITAALLLAAACTQRPAPSPPQPAPPANEQEPPPPIAERVPLADPERDQVLFSAWRGKRSDEVRGFEEYLVSEDVAQVIPTYQLLRSASMWKECHAEPFEVPPPSEWEKVRDVLILLRELKERGVLPTMEVVSAYRDPRLNRCAGGAPRSSHQQFAVDIAPLTREEGDRLCDFWRQRGKSWDMGVSRYPSGRIHIDRTGYRTWGASFRRASSYCLR